MLCFYISAKNKLENGLIKLNNKTILAIGATEELVWLGHDVHQDR